MLSKPRCYRSRDGIGEAVCKFAEVGTAFRMRRAGESTGLDKGDCCSRRVMQLVEAPVCEVYSEYGGVWHYGQDAVRFVGGRVGV